MSMASCRLGFLHDYARISAIVIKKLFQEKKMLTKHFLQVLNSLTHYKLMVHYLSV